MKHMLLILLALVSLGGSLWGAYLSSQPYTITQPDGAGISCFLSGDEYYHYLHDKDGFTIVQSEADGFYYFAEMKAGEIASSQWKAGEVNPNAVNLRKDVRLSDAQYKRQREQLETVQGRNERLFAPNVGSATNIVIFIRFNDQTEFPVSRAVYDTLFNSVASPSLKKYYEEVSYQNLTFNSYFYPLNTYQSNTSYQDYRNRNYFLTYNSVTNPVGYTSPEQGWSRILQLLYRATNAISSSVPTNLMLDSNNDNFVDNVCFVFRGAAGVWGDILWAQQATLQGQEIQINSKIVKDFILLPETQADVNVMAHEMFHAIGSPDLYRYNQTGFIPAGPWDLMQGGNNAHMTAYMKYRYGGWITDVPVISESGRYTLHPLTASQNNCFRINSPNSESEYLMVEYRKAIPGTFEEGLPGSGLIFYRINSDCDGQGNSFGPPDELMVYRPNGTNTVNGSYNSAFFSLESGRTEFGDDFLYRCFLSDDSPGRISINQISSAGDSISFFLSPRDGTVNGTISTPGYSPDFTQATVRIGTMETTPNAQGEFTLSGKQGNYPLIVTLQDFATVNTQIEVLPEQTVTQDIDLIHLPVPGNLTYILENNNLTLNWDFDGFEFPGFTQFRIYRKVNQYNFGQVGSTSERTFSTTINSPNLRYQYFVAAAFTDCVSDSSNIVVIGNTPVSDPVTSPDLTCITSVFPNPSHSVVSIGINKATEGEISLSVYNIKGQKVKTLHSARLPKGEQTITWDSTSDTSQTVGSGIYLIRLSSGTSVLQKRIIVTR